MSAALPTQEPAPMSRTHKLINLAGIALPLAGVVLAIGLLWNRFVGLEELAILAVGYVLTGLGITVGFHRLFTHRSFKAKQWVRATLAILGSAAIEGPITAWVADHRKHHDFSDQAGDPHSPHVEHGHGWSGALRGLFHAHMGWLFIHTHRGAKERPGRPAGGHDLGLGSDPNLGGDSHR